MNRVSKIICCGFFDEILIFDDKWSDCASQCVIQAKKSLKCYKQAFYTSLGCFFALILSLSSLNFVFHSGTLDSDDRC